MLVFTILNEASLSSAEAPAGYPDKYSNNQNIESAGGSHHASHSLLSPQPPYNTKRPLRRREVKHSGEDPENLERGGRDTCQLCRYFFIFLRILLKIIRNFKQKGWPRHPRLTPKSAPGTKFFASQPFFCLQTTLLSFSSFA